MSGNSNNDSDGGSARDIKFIKDISHNTFFDKYFDMDNNVLMILLMYLLLNLPLLNLHQHLKQKMKWSILEKLLM